jgi:hypothetical protein
MGVETIRPENAKVGQEVFAQDYPDIIRGVVKSVGEDFAIVDFEGYDIPQRITYPLIVKSTAPRKQVLWIYRDGNHKRDMEVFLYEDTFPPDHNEFWHIVPSCTREIEKFS